MTQNIRSCPAWFAAPQLGIFIHWGLYSVPAFAPRGRGLDQLLREDYDNGCAQLPYAEWYQNTMAIKGSATANYHKAHYGNSAYAGFRESFDTASEGFDAESWATLFAESGASYVVFVTKHHDGYCLWPTSVANPHRPGWHSKRDFVSELAQAVRAKGMRFGVYYSGGLDWTFRHHPIHNLGEMLACVPTGNDYRVYAAAQLKELIDRYSPSVIWNDIGWPNADDLPGILDYYYGKVPEGVINDRWSGDSKLFHAFKNPEYLAGFNSNLKAHIASGGSIVTPAPFADFRTIEYGLGDPPEDTKWEACRGVGHSFGFNKNEIETDYLTLDTFAVAKKDAMDKGGNLLINVGPMADGTIPQIQRDALTGRRQ